MLIKTVNKPMQRSHESLYPPSPSNALLAYSFADFITTKGEKIHTALVTRNRDLSLADDDELPTNAAELNKFHEFSQEDVKEFASSRGLRPGSTVCSEHMNDLQDLSPGDLEQK